MFELRTTEGGGREVRLGPEPLGIYEPGLRQCAARVQAAIQGGATVIPEGAVPGEGGTPDPIVAMGVAIIDIVGPLSKSGGLWNWLFGTLTYPQLVEQVQMALADRRAKALLLRIDSPGGTIAGVSDLADAIFRARAAKPVVAYCSDLAASCAYQAASQASRIYADGDALVGGIGTFIIVDDLSKMLEAMGVRRLLFSSQKDPHKGQGWPGTAITEPQAADFQRMADELGQLFVETVYRGRPAMRRGPMKLPDGRVYVGQDAAVRGLIDGVANLDDVLAAMQEGDLLASRTVRSTRTAASTNPAEAPAASAWDPQSHRYAAGAGTPPARSPAAAGATE